MGRLFAFFFIACISISTSCYQLDNPNIDPVNAVLGDISFEQTFGHRPSIRDESIRVATHLTYVLKLLREAPIEHLTNELKSQRMVVLNLLGQYILAGEFPANYDFPLERKPCFIDQYNRICAVGYLMANTEGWEAAESINKDYQYHFIQEIHDSRLDNWIAKSGLTKLECAMIQPGYSSPPPPPNNGYIPSAYGFPSAILSGVNFAMITINGVQIFHGSSSDAVAISGMITGAGQIVLGAANLDTNVLFDANGIYRNQSKNTLSLVNIGLGTAALTFGTINLLVKNKDPNQAATWNFYSFPARNGSQGMAVSWTRKF